MKSAANSVSGSIAPSFPESPTRSAQRPNSHWYLGIYFGTTGGQVYGSADGGDTWTAIVRDLPTVLSVEAQVLP